MKKLIKPKQEEESLYYSDFTGKPLNECGPDVELIMNFNYGSEFDGSSFILHLSDDDAKEVVKFLSSKISEDQKKIIQDNLNDLERKYNESMEDRNWDLCDVYFSNSTILKKLIDKEE